LVQRDEQEGRQRDAQGDIRGDYQQDKREVTEETAAKSQIADVSIFYIDNFQM